MLEKKYKDEVIDLFCRKHNLHFNDAVKMMIKMSINENYQCNKIESDLLTMLEDYDRLKFDILGEIMENIDDSTLGKFSDNFQGWEDDGYFIEDVEDEDIDERDKIIEEMNNQYLEIYEELLEKYIKELESKIEMEAGE